jgi:hypothetical protein
LEKDACGTQNEREQVPMFNATTACRLEYSAYERVAEGYGGKGFIINLPMKTLALHSQKPKKRHAWETRLL